MPVEIRWSRRPCTEHAHTRGRDVAGRKSKNTRGEDLRPERARAIPEGEPRGRKREREERERERERAKKGDATTREKHHAFAR